MFSTAVRGGKAFAAEQKLRELKKRIFRLKAMEKALSKMQNPYEIIRKFVENINSLPSAKYKQTPNEIEKNSLNSEASRGRLNYLRLKRIRQERFNNKIYERKKFKLKSLLKVGEEVLVFALALKKKDSPGNLYKCSVDTKSYLHKSETFLIINRQKIEEKLFYWLKSRRSGKKLKFRFQRKESFAILDNFDLFLHQFPTK